MRDPTEAIWNLSAEWAEYLVENQERLHRISQRDEPEEDGEWEAFVENDAEFTDRIAGKVKEIVDRALAEERSKWESALKGSAN